MHCSLQNYSTRNQATSFTSCQRHWYAALQHARVWMTSIHWELSFLQSLPYVPPPKARRDEMRKIVRSAAAGVAPKESFPVWIAILYVHNVPVCCKIQNMSFASLFFIHVEKVVKIFAMCVSAPNLSSAKSNAAKRFRGEAKFVVT